MECIVLTTCVAITKRGSPSRRWYGDTNFSPSYLKVVPKLPGSGEPRSIHHKINLRANDNNAKLAVTSAEAKQKLGVPERFSLQI